MPRPFGPFSVHTEEGAVERTRNQATTAQVGRAIRPAASRAAESTRITLESPQSGRSECCVIRVGALLDPDSRSGAVPTLIRSAGQQARSSMPADRLGRPIRDRDLVQAHHDHRQA
jgi:hypothetical protein